MNYDELVGTQENGTTNKQMLPIGETYRKQMDQKYRNIVRLKPQLAESAAYAQALKRDQQWAASQKAPQQIHYDLHSVGNCVDELELQPGNFMTLHQLLLNNPAAVTSNGFVDGIVGGLMDYTSTLHENGIFHLCYAPQTIFMYKGGTVPMLLTHGSFYHTLGKMDNIYEDFADYVAPEVMAGETVDERSDVYAIGKLIVFLFENGSLPYEYKQVVNKATAEEPSRRYASIADMKKALMSKRSTRRSLLMLLAALAVVALCLVLYLGLTPEAEDIEFVEPTKTTIHHDPFDDQFDPEMQMLLEDDSIEINEDDKTYGDKTYQDKAAEIFRKRYQKAAEKELSKVYDNNRMSAGEKTSIAGSKSMAEALSTAQAALAEEMGISKDEAQKMAEQIVSDITREQQKKLEHKGSQTVPTDE
jgi:hypothetical protein